MHGYMEILNKAWDKIEFMVEAHIHIYKFPQKVGCITLWLFYFSLTLYLTFNFPFAQLNMHLVKMMEYWGKERVKVDTLCAYLKILFAKHCLLLWECQAKFWLKVCVAGSLRQWEQARPS